MRTKPHTLAASRAAPMPDKMHPLMQVKKHYSPGELVVICVALVAFFALGGYMMLVDWIGL